MIVQSADGVLQAGIYAGDGTVLLAFSLSDPWMAANPGLAGFAVERQEAGGAMEPLLNRLNFSTAVTSATTPEQREWTASTEAPFQKFRWIDMTVDTTKAMTYRITAKLFGDGGALSDGLSVTATCQPRPEAERFTIGFTRGDIASQAYAERFGNAPVRPTPKTLDYATAPYEPAYEWLGGKARQLVFDFMQACLADQSLKIDAFVYDLDEPDFVKELITLAGQGRLRVVADNASLHEGKALEVTARQRLKDAGAQVLEGHFKRFAHDKVVVMRDSTGKALRVLAGSANFSVRGLYVQANSVFAIDDAQTAGLYAQAFDAAFTDMAHFTSQPIAAQWFDCSGDGLPDFSVSFAPHKSESVSLDRVAQRIQDAKSSVFWAVMEVNGSGPVLEALQKLPGRTDILAYGVSQTTAGLDLYRPGQAEATGADFAFLKSKVPANFRPEYDGGPGQSIHHKFVVVDFNGENPTVYAGSSNLAGGGEESNGDNLLEIRDPAAAALYAIEALRLFDHYRFRDVMKTATDTSPLVLQGPGAAAPWWKRYYDPADAMSRERKLLTGQPAG